MKRLVIILAAFLNLGVNYSWAEGNINNSNVRYVKAPRFARPLIEKWISEYSKTHPNVEFQISKGAKNQNQSDLSVVIDNNDKNHYNTNNVIFFGETAVLPITARSSEASRVLEGKHLNNKKLKQLFFLNDDFEEDVKKNKSFEQLTIYSGSNASSIANSFANYFGVESNSFRGKRISGDDLNINTALLNDPLGVSFNTLSNIYDLENRHLKNEISIIGLDLKKEIANKLENSGTLDDVINILEKEKTTEVAIEKVGVAYKNFDEEVNKFLQWILTDGTKYNHQYGLLNLDKKNAEAEIGKVNNILSLQK